MSPADRPLRLGFAGVGWIGAHRMQAITASGVATVAAIYDPDEALTRKALEASPGAQAVASFEALLESDVDGVVIATPSALHAEQSIAALSRGLPVFCQKPLGRTGSETRNVVDAARRADRLLGVDLSYRFTSAIAPVRDLVRSGELGQIYAVDLVFHNAYGPDKPWFYDRSLSGGGCLIDLGIHLIDLMFWTLDSPAVSGVTSRLFQGGRRITSLDAVEDYAIATIDLSGGTAARIACSWKLQAGCEAVIEANFYGTSGAVSFSNVNGSFYDFTAARMSGTQKMLLVEPPDEWGGRAAVDWARRLSESNRFDPAADEFVVVASVLDSIYAANHEAAELTTR